MSRYPRTFDENVSRKSCLSCGDEKALIGICRTEGHRDWYPATMGAGGGGALPLYTQALRKIERLRRAVKN